MLKLIKSEKFDLTSEMIDEADHGPGPAIGLGVAILLAIGVAAGILTSCLIYALYVFFRAPTP